MRLTQRLTITLAAALLLGAAVGSATARNLSLSNQNIRVTWLTYEFVTETITIRCRLTMEGSFHARTLAKVARSLVGAITRASFKQETCTNGTLATFNGRERYNGTTTNDTLPWHLSYESFTGSLPNITSVRTSFSRFRFGLTIPTACTGQYGTGEDSITWDLNREAGGAITSLMPIEGRNIMTLFRRDAGILCPSTWRFSGLGTVALLGTTTAITVTLI